MDDLISRKAAIDAHYEYCNKHPDAGFPVWSLKILEKLPSADAVEVVRCKDCKYWKEYEYIDGKLELFPWCGLNMTFSKEDDFCSHAERREDE